MLLFIILKCISLA